MLRDNQNIEIPDSAALLFVNIQMLELFVKIQENQLQIQNNRTGDARFKCAIYDYAELCKSEFTNIQFRRGLGILYYVQARRTFKQFRKIEEFKNLIKKSG